MQTVGRRTQVWALQPTQQWGCRGRLLTPPPRLHGLSGIRVQASCPAAVVSPPASHFKWKCVTRLEGSRCLSPAATGLGPVVAGPATRWDFLVLCRHLRWGRGDGHLHPGVLAAFPPPTAAQASCSSARPLATRHVPSVPLTQRGQPCLNRNPAVVICTQLHCRPTAHCSSRPGPLSSGVRGPSDCPGLCCAREGGR